jgi:hypothetical protein
VLCVCTIDTSIKSNRLYYLTLLKMKAAK